jgi:hypothetical protein
MKSPSTVISKSQPENHVLIAAGVAIPHRSNAPYSR